MTPSPIFEAAAQSSPRQTAREWLRKELATSPGKCPICNVIHAAHCPHEEWLCDLLASYAIDQTEQVREQESAVRRILEMQKAQLEDSCKQYCRIAEQAEAEREESNGYINACSQLTRRIIELIDAKLKEQPAHPATPEHWARCQMLWCRDMARQERERDSR